MIFAGIIEDKIIELPNAVTVEINQSLDVPADDMTAVFEYREDFPNISRIFAIDKKFTDIYSAVKSKNVIFSGVVDETVLSADTEKASITVYARGLAALLLDNECRPQTYINPDTDVIYTNHLSRFGVELSGNEAAKRKGTLNIFKGYSHYRVLEEYCSRFLDSRVRIDHRGICHTDCLGTEERLSFDNKDGIKFSSVSVSRENYGRISQVFVCTDETLKYNTVLTDEDAVKNGIVRERYLNANSNSDYSVSDGDKLIEKGRTSAYTITLISDENVLNKLGCRCTVNTPVTSGDNMIVHEIHYLKTAGSTKTVLKLVKC